MKGYAQRRLDQNAWEIALIDSQRNRSWTFTFFEHDFPRNGRCETTIIPFEKDMDLLQALAQALQEMGVFPESATTAELRATKFHLEDMRKLALKGDM